MPTMYVRVAPGTTTPPMLVGPLINVMLGPQILGGTCLLEFSPNGVANWLPWDFGTIGAVAAYRPNVAMYVRATATTSAASLILSDMAQAQTQYVTQLIDINVPLASPSSAVIQKLCSVRIPPLYLPPNFRMHVQGALLLSNNANVKTLTMEVNGNNLFTSPSLASALNYNFMVAFGGRGDGQSWQGYGPGASGGIGVSTTAYPTLTRDYINQETEFSISITKATAGDTAQLESLLVELY